MSPVRTLGGSKRGPTAGQVMCTGRIIFVKIVREVHFHWHTISDRESSLIQISDISDAYLKGLISFSSGCIAASYIYK